MKNKILYTTILGVFALILSSASAQTSPDAIAIRIMQNPNHYSALRWYQEKHFTGSPQSIVVDGYNGIRDGRTVYVNAANVVNDKLYTNIYLISYNQSAENATVDIFGKMVSHWKFNANITDPEEKAKIVRDTVRLEKMGDIKYLLGRYKITKGRYPELNAGSYVKNVSVSTWPSWQDVFAKELKTKLPEDATNKLGACPANFNPKTCWDEKERKFADSDLNDPRINLPVGSSAFVYQTDSNGLAYDLCSTMESGYIQGLSNGACNVINNYRLTESSDEHAPQFTGVSLPTINSGLEFVGYIKADDQDNDDLIWTFDFQPDFAPANQWSSWSGGVAPIVSNSPNENEKKIMAPKTGKRGSYFFTAKVSDGKASTTQVFTITVVNYGQVVLAIDKEYVASTTNPFTTSFKVYDLITDYPLGHTFQYGVSFLTTSLTEIFEKIAPKNEEYLFSFSGILTPDNSQNIAGVYPFIFNVKDQYDATTTKEFNVKVINNPPIIATPLGCQQITRQNNPYQSCQVKTTDLDGNLVNKFTLAHTASGISIDNNGLIQGVPVDVAIQPISIVATDEYGAISQTVSYDLHVNNYCGDGIRQGQNTEGRGGVSDNGQEQCDKGVNNSDAKSCSKQCTWTIKGLAISNFSPYVMGGQGSVGDGVFYDNNGVSSVVVNQPDANPYNYLKLSGIQRTPYAWLSAMSENSIVKMRTYTGPRRSCVNGGAINNCSWDIGTVENQGQSLGVYPTGGQRPGRTAVNAETGDVWVHNRYEQNISKLDINGNIKKTCKVDPSFNPATFYTMADCDGNPATPDADAYNGGVANPACWYAGGGVSIAENGDVWAGNYYTGMISRIPGGDNDGCVPIKQINSGGNVYGMAIDGVGNLWANTRNMKVTKIDTAAMSISTYPLAYDIYGITVDADDNVWGGSYDGVPNNGFGGMQKILKNSPTNTPSIVYNFGNDVTGVSIDSFNGVWGSGYDDLNIVKIDKSSGLATQKLNCGVYTHGVSGNSEGDVFGVGVNDAKVYFFNATIGSNEGTYCVFGDCHVTAIYTYSDMAGLNRAMVLRSGNWMSQVFDGGDNEQHWGKISWDQVIPSAKQKIEVYVGIGNSPNNLIFNTAANWNAQANPAVARQGRYVQVKILMRSNQLGVSPVIFNIKFNEN